MKNVLNMPMRHCIYFYLYKNKFHDLKSGVLVICVTSYGWRHRNEVPWNFVSWAVFGQLFWFLVIQKVVGFDRKSQNEITLPIKRFKTITRSKMPDFRQIIFLRACKVPVVNGKGHPLMQPSVGLSRVPQTFFEIVATSTVRVPQMHMTYTISTKTLA